MKLIIRLLKRNHKLWEQNRIQKRLNLCLIRDDDNAFQRNKKAIEYIDSLKEKDKQIMEIRHILTCFKTSNILDEVNMKGE